MVYVPGLKAASRWLMASAVLLLANVSLAGCHKADSGVVNVAVATNFLDTAQEIEAAFEQGSGTKITLSGGASGQIYAQIINGAPYDIFLSADQMRPERLEAAGKAVAGSRFTYAVGALVLWSKDAEMLAGGGEDVLRAGRFRALAVANPELAPYGAAAMQALVALDLGEQLQPKLVMGQNIGQAFALVASGNAELGFVARSQVETGAYRGQGSSWVVPPALYAPIQQDGVLLARAEGNPGAAEFLDFLKGEAAQAILARHGYEPG